MKKFIVLSILILSNTAFAFESGEYINHRISASDAPMYKSVKLETSSCPNGGVIAKFYGADAMNLCVGKKEERIFRYKKCLGIEVGQYFKRCIGVNKEVVQLNSKSVTLDKADQAIVLAEKTIDDGLILFEQEYRLQNLGKGQLRLTHSFQSHHDNRSGSSEYTFDQK
jgi:hypothetical protein